MNESFFPVERTFRLTGGRASADEDFRPVLVTKPPHRIFTPHGFDSNDNVQVVVDDELQSACYKVGPVKVLVDKKEKVITIENQTYFYSVAWCAELETPYYRTVDLGILDTGSYAVVTENEDAKIIRKGTMKVTTATTLAADDYLYAPVTEVSVRLPQAAGQPALLTLRGTFSNSCMKLNEVRPIYSPENVIEVLPIAEMESENCHPASIHFEKSVPLTQIPKGRTLVHVRSLNGQSINQVYSF